MEVNEKELSYWKSLFLISSLFVASSVDGLLHSSLIPMIPLHVETLGLSETVSTLLFSIVPCTILLISPILGHYAKTLGLGVMLYTAPVLTGAVAAFFGFSKSAWSMCIALIGLGIGGALFWSSVYLLLSLYYPKRQALLIGILEIATGVGAALGPPFAIFFSHALGFWSPFLLCCGFEILGAAVLFVLSLPVHLSLPRHHLIQLPRLQANQTAKLVMVISQILDPILDQMNLKKNMMMMMTMMMILKKKKKKKIIKKKKMMKKLLRLILLISIMVPKIKWVKMTLVRKMLLHFVRVKHQFKLQL